MGINDDADLDLSQVEDMRGSGGGGGLGGGLGGALGGALGGGGGGGGLGGMIPGGGAGALGGVGTLLLCCVLGVLGLTGNLSGLGVGGDQGSDNSSLAEKCAVGKADRFEHADCRNVLYVNSIQDYWKTGLPENFGKQYQSATTRFFSGAVSTGCGRATSGVGPFYCPADNHIYIDLSFYDELGKRFGAPGQFAQAYVVAHEYGHHVQTVLGTEAQMRRAQQRDPGNANKYSIMLELQADCYAGVWARHAPQTKDQKGNALFTSVSQQEINEALQAAAAVGDDNIQKQSGGGINQDSWTHGSSADRQRWFTQGYSTGDPKTCNTFGTA